MERWAAGAGDDHAGHGRLRPSVYRFTPTEAFACFAVWPHYRSCCVTETNGCTTRRDPPLDGGPCPQDARGTKVTPYLAYGFSWDSSSYS